MLSDKPTAQYTSFNNDIERKYVKANFDAVTEDVILERQLVVTPVEPTPEHKIVVEFAGQWPHNAASLLLSKTDEQYERITKPRADVNADHRSVAIFKGLEPEPRNLYLTITRRGMPQPLTFLLAENITPVEKETEMPEWDNVLVPIRPLAYLDGAKNKGNAAELRSGCLYLFWKAKLWRELVITNSSYYEDVDVEYYRFRDQQEQQKAAPLLLDREAEGFPLNSLYIPYKINGEVQTGDNGLTLVFSPEALSFSQIEAYEANPDKLKAAGTSLDEISIYSAQQSFSEQTDTIDVLSSTVSPTSTNDMSWLSGKCMALDSLKKSNIAVAFVDGKNDGLRINLDVGLEQSEDTPPLIAHLQHDKSEEEDSGEWWQSRELAEVEDTSHLGSFSWSHWRTALFSGFPNKGTFSLYIINPRSEDDMEMVYTGLPYEALVQSSATDDTPTAEEESHVETATTDENAAEENTGVTPEMIARYQQVLNEWDL